MGSDQGTRDKSSIFQLEIDGNWKYYLLVETFGLLATLLTFAGVEVMPLEEPVVKGSPLELRCRGRQKESMSLAWRWKANGIEVRNANQETGNLPPGFAEKYKIIVELIALTNTFFNEKGQRRSPWTLFRTFPNLPRLS